MSRAGKKKEREEKERKEIDLLVPRDGLSPTLVRFYEIATPIVS